MDAFPRDDVETAENREPESTTQTVNTTLLELQPDGLSSFVTFLRKWAGNVSETFTRASQLVPGEVQMFELVTWVVPGLRSQWGRGKSPVAPPAFAISKKKYIRSAGGFSGAK